MTWQVAEANVIVLNLRRPSNTWHATKSSCLASIIKKKTVPQPAVRRAAQLP